MSVGLSGPLVHEEAHLQLSYVVQSMTTRHNTTKVKIDFVVRHHKKVKVAHTRLPSVGFQS